MKYAVKMTFAVAKDRYPGNEKLLKNKCTGF